MCACWLRRPKRIRRSHRPPAASRMPRRHSRARRGGFGSGHRRRRPLRAHRDRRPVRNRPTVAGVGTEAGGLRGYGEPETLRPGSIEDVGGVRPVVRLHTDDPSRRQLVLPHHGIPLGEYGPKLLGELLIVDGTADGVGEPRVGDQPGTVDGMAEPAEVRRRPGRRRRSTHPGPDRAGRGRGARRHQPGERHDPGGRRSR